MELDGSPDRDPEEAPASTKTKPAPVCRLPKTPFNSIEFPGPISSNPSSLNKALESLGSQKALDACFNRATRMLELRYDVHDSWSHPIIGESVPVQRLVLKITRRRRKPKPTRAPNTNTLQHSDAVANPSVHEDVQTATKGSNHSAEGVFKAEVIGVVKSTVRFRGEHIGPNLEILSRPRY